MWEAPSSTCLRMSEEDTGMTGQPPLYRRQVRFADTPRQLSSPTSSHTVRRHAPDPDHSRSIRRLQTGGCKPERPASSWPRHDRRTPGAIMIANRKRSKRSPTPTRRTPLVWLKRASTGSRRRSMSCWRASRACCGILMSSRRMRHCRPLPQTAGHASQRSPRRLRR